jgi:hypothetical protein
MFKIEYEIKLNDEGRPCIDLPKDYEHRPEDKFFWIEMARYFLQVTRGRMTAPPYDQNTMNMMDISIPLLGQIGDEMARIVYHNMIAAGEANKLIGNDWDMFVQTIVERDAIPDVGIVHNNRLYLRQEGLKVFVLEGGTIYELKGGTTNENWIEI